MTKADQHKAFVDVRGIKVWPQRDGFDFRAISFMQS